MRRRSEARIEAWGRRRVASPPARSGRAGRGRTRAAAAEAVSKPSAPLATCGCGSREHRSDSTRRRPTTPPLAHRSARAGPCTVDGRPGHSARLGAGHGASAKNGRDRRDLGLERRQLSQRSRCRASPARSSSSSSSSSSDEIHCRARSQAVVLRQRPMLLTSDAGGTRELAGVSPAPAMKPANGRRLAARRRSSATSRAGSGTQPPGAARARAAAASRRRSGPAWKRGQRGWKTQARRRGDRRRHVAAQHDPLAVAGRRAAAPPTAAPRCTDASAARRSTRLADLDDAAEVHDRDPVGDLPDHRQVVRDEDVGEVEVALQAPQQVQDLRLDRDVERRDRLVADDQLRLRARARARRRCAAAGRPRTRADSGCSAPGSGRPRSSSSCTRVLRVLRRPWIANGAPTICPTVLRGFSDEYGSWKIICISRRSGRS